VQPLALGPTDTVLGADASAKRRYDLEYGVTDGFRLVHRVEDVHMQVALVDMPEKDRPRSLCRSGDCIR